MVYKRFYIVVTVRMVFILLTCLWLSHELNNAPRLYTTIVISLLLITQTILLLHYINKTNVELARFFDSLKDEYSSSKIDVAYKKGSHKKLTEILTETSEIIRSARLEKEKQNQYFRFVVENIDVGLISYMADGKIKHTNSALTKFIGDEIINDLSELENLIPDLKTLLANERIAENRIFKYYLNSELKILLVKKFKFKYCNEWLNLLTFQDVKSEWQDNEIKSWQKLIRVLTHEIMNSITPVTTLAVATKRCLLQPEFAQINSSNEFYMDALRNLKTIEARSAGLVDFVDKYKSLNNVANIELSVFSVKEMLDGVTLSFMEIFKEKNIELSISVSPPTLKLKADKNLIETVIINLLKNAIDAVEISTQKTISINAYVNLEGISIIEIQDNGVGIDQDVVEDIFVPFFTTKENGSGIGLSLSRQIMRMHGGEIDHVCELGQTKFILAF